MNNFYFSKVSSFCCYCFFMEYKIKIQDYSSIDLFNKDNYL